MHRHLFIVFISLIISIYAFATDDAVESTAARQPKDRCLVAVKRLDSGLAQGLMARGYKPYEARCKNTEPSRGLFGNDFNCINSGLIAVSNLEDYEHPPLVRVTLGFRYKGKSVGLAQTLAEGRTRESAARNAANRLAHCSEIIWH